MLLHGTKTMMSVVLIASMHKIVHMHYSPHDSHKTKQRCKVSASPLCRPQKVMHSWACQPLLPPPMFHSTPIATPRRLSSDPTSAHLSFDQSWGLLPPVDLGGGEPCPISSPSAPIQAGISSVPGPLPLPSESVSALRLTADHTKEIFNLACERASAEGTGHAGVCQTL